jgi:hypothetical protein
MLFELYSHWIFLWFLLYYFKIISANPTYFLIIAFIIILFGFFILIFLKASFINLFTFLLYNIFIKLIPILLISNFTYNLYHILFGCYIYILYLLYMIFSKKNPFDYYKKLIEIFHKSKEGYKIFINLIINDIYFIWSPFRSRI